MSRPISGRAQRLKALTSGAVIAERRSHRAVGSIKVIIGPSTPGLARVVYDSRSAFE